MKKIGFTMPELLVTLGIVAVAAAVAAPVMGNLMPDKYKLKAIECYNLINAATEEFLSNEGIYYSTDDYTYHTYNEDGSIARTLDRGIDEPDGHADCEGLMCWREALVEPYLNTGIGFNKYPNLLRRKLGINNDVASDGTTWNIRGDLILVDSNGTRVRNFNGDSTGLTTYVYYQITLDVDPSNNGSGRNDENCFYSAGCQSPDQFRIYVNPEGNLFAGDPMMEAYLANPLNMNSKRQDREAAERFANSGKNYIQPRFLWHD